MERAVFGVALNGNAGRINSVFREGFCNRDCAGCREFPVRRELDGFNGSVVRVTGNHNRIPFFCGNEGCDLTQSWLISSPIILPGLLEM